MVIWLVGMPGAPPRGTPDPEVLGWCETHSFMLVTNNRKYMPVHLSNFLAEDRHIPGILELNPNMGIGDTVDELWLIWDVSDATMYQDQIAYLPLSY